MKPTAFRKPGAWTSVLLLSASVCCTLTTCAPSLNSLERVKRAGVLRVATINSPTTYYIGPSGPTGYEYDLAQGLADRLGVQLEIDLASSPAAAVARVRSGQSDLAAADLGISSLRNQGLRYSRPVQTVVPQLIYRAGGNRPEALGGLGDRLVVPAGSSQSERLATLRKSDARLGWQETQDDSEDLLEQVAEGTIDYTVANSDLVAINQRYYPKLRVAFSLADSQDLAWAFAADRDSSLFNAANQYLETIAKTELARLRDRHFGHIDQVDAYGAVALATHAQTRLPQYRAAFERAAQRYHLDWRLLAAMAYQESHWDPLAVSPTGVRGIMQLTTDTAFDLKVADREDPTQSIAGGARYLRSILDAMPEQIEEPDRTWLALAAYNMGQAHLDDVRDLTVSLGGDGTRWLDISGHLPLLAQPKWYGRTRHGYARGRQAMQYVGNIRTYYDMLVWITDNGDGGASPAPPPQQTVLASPPDMIVPGDTAQSAEQILRIRSPIL